MVAEAEFWKAVKTGDRHAVESLQAAEPGLATARLDGASAILVAAYHHKPEVTQCLRPHVGELDIFESSALGDVGRAKLLPLHSAAAARSMPIARLLLERGAPVNARQGSSEGGFTPLMEAALNGQVEMVELLMRHGADASLKDRDGKTAADHARERGHAGLAGRLGLAPWS